MWFKRHQEDVNKKETFHNIMVVVLKNYKMTKTVNALVLMILKHFLTMLGHEHTNMGDVEVGTCV